MQAFKVLLDFFLMKEDHQSIAYIGRKFRNSVLTLALLLCFMGGIFIYLVIGFSDLMPGLNDRLLQIKDSTSLQIHEIQYNELNRLKSEFQNYSKLIDEQIGTSEPSTTTVPPPPPPIGNTVNIDNVSPAPSAPNGVYNSVQGVASQPSKEKLPEIKAHIQRIIGILFRISKEQTLSIKDIHSGLEDAIDLLNLLSKSFFLILGLAIVFVIVISIRTFSDIRQGLLNTAPAERPGDFNKDCLKFARAAIDKAKDLQQDLISFEKNYNVGLAPQNIAIAAPVADDPDGPPPTPQAVRFNGPIPVMVNLEGVPVVFTTVNYSETGMLLKGPENASKAIMQQGQAITGEIGDDNGKAAFKGEIIRVQREKNYFIYGIKFVQTPW
ncbi:MAG: PilZ domain-containing protein [Pseudomonadota bacterium]